MLKYFVLNLIVLCSASIVRVPTKSQGLKQIHYDLSSRDLEQIVENWEPHVRDFLNLIDDEKLLKIMSKYTNDPDALNLFAFIGSSQFKDIVLEIESIDEFKEAVNFLKLKGYEVTPIIELLNSILELQKRPPGPPVSNPVTVTTLIQEIVQSLPIEEMKKLFNEKLKTNPEIAKLFEALTSDEFKEILKRFSKSPKFLEINKIFEYYGIHFRITKKTWE